MRQLNCQTILEMSISDFPLAIKIEFEKASQDIQAQGLCVDGYLKDGALDCSACLRAMRSATGRTLEIHVFVTTEEISEMLDEWDESKTDDIPWANASAIAFLQVCKKNHLGFFHSY